MHLQLIGTTRYTPDAEPRDVYAFDLFGYDELPPQLLFVVSSTHDEDGDRHIYITVSIDGTSKHSAVFDAGKANLVLTALAIGMSDGFDRVNWERPPVRAFQITTQDIREAEIDLGGVLRGWAPADFLPKLALLLAMSVDRAEVAEAVTNDAF